MSVEQTDFIIDIGGELIESFNLNELNALSFFLGIDWEELKGDTKSTKAISLILYIARNGRLHELVERLRQERPEGNWPELSEIPSSAKQITDASLWDTRREQALQNYLGNLGDLLTEKNLAASPPNSPVRALAKVYTDSLLPKLDKNRLVLVLRFLADANLLGDNPITDFSNLDLSNMDLSEINLQGAKLWHADFSGANLERANLSQTELYWAKFIGTKLTSTNLTHAELFHANLIKADLSFADLTGANLSEAFLGLAHVTAEQLDKALILENATLPNGQKYYDALPMKEKIAKLMETPL